MRKSFLLVTVSYLLFIANVQAQSVELSNDTLYCNLTIDEVGTLKAQTADISDLNIIKDGFNVEISSIDYNFLESGQVEFQQNHAWGLGINNGGSITVNIEKKESTFYLSEVYFHLYSEHRIENKQYPLKDAQAS